LVLITLNPSPGSPNYGYEFWMGRAGNTTGRGHHVKDFDGGLYAVRRCQGAEHRSGLGELVSWLETSLYSLGQHQWLKSIWPSGCPTTTSCRSVYADRLIEAASIFASQPGCHPAGIRSGLPAGLAQVE
jgi:hypothetical protein